MLRSIEGNTPYQHSLYHIVDLIFYPNHSQLAASPSLLYARAVVAMVPTSLNVKFSFPLSHVRTGPVSLVLMASAKHDSAAAVSAAVLNDYQSKLASKQ